jgi:hypothetical protein
MQFFVTHGLPLGPANRARYWDKLKIAHKNDCKGAIDYLYRSLDALDAKSSSLLQFNSILMATILIIADATRGMLTGNSFSAVVSTYPTIAAALVPSISALMLLLLVEGVKFYPTYHTLELSDSDALLNAQADKIIGLRNRRIIFSASPGLQRSLHWS